MDGGQLFIDDDDGAGLGSWLGQRTSARQHIRTTILPSHTHQHDVCTGRCPQLLLISLLCHARAAGRLPRQPASRVAQAALRAAEESRMSGRRPRAEVGPEAARDAHGGLQCYVRALPAVEGGFTALNALSPRPCRPRGRQGRFE